MSCFQTSKNVAVLHSDLSLMPTSRKAWTSWNYMALSHAGSGNGSGNGSGGGGGGGSDSKSSHRSGISQVSLTYDMNILQHIPAATFGDVLVSLNPLHEPDPATVQGRYSYSHPLYTVAAVEAQAKLPAIQNARGISYAGAWTKYGFHEDGFSSGLAAARDHLGAVLPFDFVDSTFSRGRRPELGMADHVLRLVLLAIQLFAIDLPAAAFSAVKPRPWPLVNGLRGAAAAAKNKAD